MFTLKAGTCTVHVQVYEAYFSNTILFIASFTISVHVYHTLHTVG